MASVRSLKKDIAFLVSEIISDTQLFLYMNPKKNTEEAYSIIEDSVDMYNQLFARANHPDGKNDPKLIKQHYKSIRKDLLEQSHNFFERISKLNNN